MHRTLPSNLPEPGTQQALKRRGTVFFQRFTFRAMFVILTAILVAVTASSTLGQAQDTDAFPNLEAGTRVYDETGSALTQEQTADLERQLSNLESVDANVIVIVRALDATSEETLEQVEALQQAWVAETGANQDTAVAILINRNPDDPNDARAGIYVGSTFDDSNVPPDEQEAIVSEALIPPLREGDVYGSLVAGIDRLGSSIVNGPPQNAFETWASDAADSWLPWAGVGTVIAGLAATLAVFRTAQRTTLPDLQPTTTRPGTLPPALAGALATGGPQASAIPALLLDLATRDALAIEPESEGGVMTKPKVQVRLVDRGPVRDDIEAVLWTEMEKRAENGIVSSKNLSKVARDSTAVREAVASRMRAEGWIEEETKTRRNGLVFISIAALVLAVAAFVIGAVAENWFSVVGVAALVALTVTALVLYSLYPALTPRGQEAALPWKAYCDGLKQAAKDDAVALDLNAVLADSIAMNLGSAMHDRLKAANESGQMLSAFTSPYQSNQSVIFPWWIAFNSSVTTSSGAGAGGVVSGGGAGGGGGAAGST